MNRVLHSVNVMSPQQSIADRYDDDDDDDDDDDGDSWKLIKLILSAHCVNLDL